MDTTELKLSQFEGLAIRVYGTVEDPLFVGVDVQNVLGLKLINYKRQFITGNDYIKLSIHHGGQSRELNMFTEHGIYQIIYRTRSDVGERFRNYVTETLKNIRLARQIESEVAHQKLRQFLADLIGVETGSDLYIMQCQGNYKIGRSNDVENRVSSLQTGNAYPITIHSRWKDQGKFEKLVHAKAELFLKREIGEWFSPYKEDNIDTLIKWIDSLDDHGIEE